MTSHGVPDWLRPVQELCERTTSQDMWLRPEPDLDGNGRPSAVLVLFGEGDHGPDLLLIERSHTMRSHAGQPAFPGGRLEPDDSGPVDAALRETAEETGLDPSGVDILGTLPPLYLSPSDHLVTPVIGWWHTASEVGVVDPAEVASVHRVPLATLLDPDHRFRVRHSSGYVGPAFGVAGLVVWGFTGAVLDRLFALVGWERPWDRGRVRPLTP